MLVTYPISIMYNTYMVLYINLLVNKFCANFVRLPKMRGEVCSGNFEFKVIRKCVCVCFTYALSTSLMLKICICALVTNPALKVYKEYLSFKGV